MNIINFTYWAKNRKHVEAMHDAYGNLLLNIDDLLSFEHRETSIENIERQVIVLKNIGDAATQVLKMERM